MGFEGVREAHLHRFAPAMRAAPLASSIRRAEVERGHVGEVFEMELDAAIPVFGSTTALMSINV